MSFSSHVQLKSWRDAIPASIKHVHTSNINSTVPLTDFGTFNITFFTPFISQFFHLDVVGRTRGSVQIFLAKKPLSLLEFDQMKLGVTERSHAKTSKPFQEGAVGLCMAMAFAIFCSYVPKRLTGVRYAVEESTTKKRVGLGINDKDVQRSIFIVRGIFLSMHFSGHRFLLKDILFRTSTSIHPKRVHSIRN